MCMNDVKKAAGTVAKAVTSGDVGKGVGAIAGANAGAVLGGGLPNAINAGADLGSGTGLGTVLFGENNSPDAPGMDPTLEALKRTQMANAKQFRSNLPGMEQKADENLRAEGARGLSADSASLKDNQNQRGLLYGGLAQGQQSKLRAGASANLAGAIAKSDTGYRDAADNLDAQAVDTAVGIQKSAQSIQDSIYSQAQARLAGQNSMIGNIASTAALAALA